MLHSLREYLEATGQLDQFELSDLTPTIVDAWLSWQLNEKNVTVSTINTRLSALKAYLKAATLQDQSLAPSYQAIAALRSLEKPKIISPEAIEAILSVIPEQELRDQFLLNVLFDTGCRAEELIALTPQDATIESNGLGQIWLDRDGPSERVIFLGPDSRKLLQPYLASVAQQQWLFTKPGTTQALTVGDLDELVERYAAQACYSDMPRPVTAAMVRSARAMQLYREGMAPIFISAVLDSSAEETLCLINPTLKRISAKKFNLPSANVNMIHGNWGLVFHPSPAAVTFQVMMGKPAASRLICQRRMSPEIQVDDQAIPFPLS